MFWFISLVYYSLIRYRKKLSILSSFFTWYQNLRTNLFSWMNTRKPYPPAILSSLQLPVRPWLKNSLPIAHPSGSDTSSLHITVHKLDGKNYLQWAQSVKIVICGWGKLGYITGELPAPSPNDPSYKTWLAENSIVLAWLINFMDPKISCRYLWFKTANEVWDAACRMYSDLRNASQIFKIRLKLKEMK